MYNYENYDKVKNDIEQKRLSAIAEADMHSAMLGELSPEIREIDRELSGTGLLLFKTACSGGNIAPIRERRKQWEKDIPAVFDILKRGSEAARAVAANTLADVRSAMRINYFEDTELICRQAEQYRK